MLFCEGRVGVMRVLVSLTALLVLVSAAAAFATPDDASDKAVVLARAALNRQLGPAAASATLSSVVETTWPDSSLGCPQPGMMYAPVLVPGHRVVLRVGDASHEVHVGAGQAVVCGDGQAGSAAAKSGAVEADSRTVPVAVVGLRLAERAREALAARLKVPRTAIKVEFYRPTTWPDAGLGCARSGEALTPEPTKGFLIHLRTGDKTYPFHADMTHAVECPGDTPDTTPR